MTLMLMTSCWAPLWSTRNAEGALCVSKRAACSCDASAPARRLPSPLIAITRAAAHPERDHLAAQEPGFGNTRHPMGVEPLDGDRSARNTSAPGACCARLSPIWRRCRRTPGRGASPRLSWYISSSGSMSRRRARRTTLDEVLGAPS
ncbi:hypothetical protein predicted by Glimmer/Critica [Sorangium cellulosum So ce56]|uniref:Uncharacterized protein n=1 Tax=Sorangium cellulosum (strain So ce56) TaxID=448385 RepID=A9FER6_SORC5|nr:hypothetical protein predicted by Glimmer/Critica [Sorangium cellulosum So ce56]